ncbi:MAG: hypothetical protein GF355_17290 [Candidatus Eisenbacteria bacterium]|nr:hypothetical protein [Candidatus Eisenbacteria bacterium]
MSILDPTRVGRRLCAAARREFPGIRWQEPEGACAVLTERLRLRDGAQGGDPWPSGSCRDTFFIDLETLGFIGRPLFLIGILHPTSRRTAQLVQYLARDYAEEEAILHAFAARHGRPRRWVTFNGKAFDGPFLTERCRFHRLEPPRPREHLDLLHAARRVWRGVLPDCRLTTLESRVCGVWRGEDVDGGRVPEAYHEFVRTGEPGELVQILKHNRHDLLTLGKLYRILRNAATS